MPEVAEKKVNAREALLLAAAELFTTKGYAAVSTRELADRAGVNLGAIQYHFGSKAKLFVETIRGLMREKRSVGGEFLPIVDDSLGSLQAAELLYYFVRGFLSDACHPQGPDVCRLMYREVLGSTPEHPELHEVLVSSVVDEFIRPLDNQLKTILRCLAPNANELQLGLAVQSVIGQCSFYVTHRAFVARLRESDFTAEPMFAEVCRHITGFTLRAVGVQEQVIQEVLRENKSEV